MPPPPIGRLFFVGEASPATAGIAEDPACFYAARTLSDVVGMLPPIKAGHGWSAVRQTLRVSYLDRCAVIMYAVIR